MNNFDKGQKFLLAYFLRYLGYQFGAKIHVFRIFRPLDGVEITRKCRFWIGHDWLPLFWPLTHFSSPSGDETVAGPLFWGLSGQKFDPGPIWLLGVAGEVLKPHKRIGNGQKPMFWPLMSLRSLYEGETATSPFLGVPPKSWIFGNHHFSSRSHRGTYEGSN